MFLDDFMRTSFADLNKDLSLRYLARALPGLSISASAKQTASRRPPWGCRRVADPSNARPVAGTTETEWSDAESNFASDSEWPDWSRWTRRKSSSSSSRTSLDLNIMSEDESEAVSPTIALDALSTKQANFKGSIVHIEHAGLEGPHTPPSPARAHHHFAEPHTPTSAVPVQPPTSGSSAPCSTSCHSKTCNHVAALHPAKTGFALWVGNLGPKTTLLDLRSLFGTPDLQSIYLIQRTGCAFVNYNNEQALDYAMKLFEKRGGRLHDHDLVIKAQYTNEDPSKSNENMVAPPADITPVTSSSRNRYFICKSLLVDDLEQAKKTGLWSTQLRNKERFNQAFYNTENTYLVFSANRTSAFYGIAKLESPFRESNGCCAEAQMNGGKDSAISVEPEIKHTPAIRHPEDNTSIPAGDTVLDPLRGSQFWKVCGCECVEPEVEKWTAPAKIRWLSSSNSIVPFSRTRQLKNSLNMNKPIKVARDGTEIDPEVGEKLCQMFD